MTRPDHAPTRRDVEAMARRLWPGATVHVTGVGLRGYRVEVVDVDGELRAMEGPLGDHEDEGAVRSRLHQRLHERARVAEADELARAFG